MSLIARELDLLVVVSQPCVARDGYEVIRILRLLTYVNTTRSLTARFSTCVSHDVKHVGGSIHVVEHGWFKTNCLKPTVKLDPECILGEIEVEDLRQTRRQFWMKLSDYVSTRLSYFACMR